MKVGLLLHRVTIVGGLLLFAAQSASFAQDLSLEELFPGLQDRAVVLDIVARVVEQNQEVVWNSVESKVTIPGRPVMVKLLGANVVVAVQFTPYRRRNGDTVLVAQGQIWVDIPNEGLHYVTTMETIPLEYGEPIYFFPLGAASPNEARIELQVEMRPYIREPAPQVTDSSGVEAPFDPPAEENEPSP
jgi:hypothetical protein